MTAKPSLGSESQEQGIISLIIYPLATIGLTVTAYILYTITNLIWLYFLRSSSLSRYRHGGSNVGTSKAPWALITGASDGIGKAFAQELAAKGFNLVLHGRNGKKLEGVKSDIIAAAKLAKSQQELAIRLLVMDAASFSSTTIDDYARTLISEGLNLTILINNVGGTGPIKPTFSPLQDKSGSDIDAFIALNAAFVTHVTRALLPLLKKNQPGLIINVGSITGLLASPYITPYAGSKAYDLSFSRSLTLEMKAEGLAPTGTSGGVEVMGLIVAAVRSQYESAQPPGMFNPTARELAQAALARVGCGYDIVTPHWPHALQIGIVKILPQWMIDKVLIDAARAELGRDNPAYGAVEKGGVELSKKVD